MKDNKIWNIYFAAALTGILVFFVVLFRDGVKAAEWLVMEGNFNYQFTDHFRHMILAQDLRNVYMYTTDASLPPFAYLFYSFLLRLDPTRYPMQLDSCFLMEFQEYQMLIFVLYLCLVTALLVISMRKLISWEHGDVRFSMFTISVLFSAAMASGAYERGNIVLLTLLILIMALYLKDSESRWKRELAMILIAMAAGLKIYPAVMGLLYIKEKRWKETARLMIYGLFVFFVPFAFTGGWQGMIQYLEILKATAADETIRFTNVGLFVPGIMRIMGWTDAASGVLIGKICTCLLLAVCLAAFVYADEKWKGVLYLSFLMVLFVPKSFRYVAIYMLLPLLMWGREKTKKGDEVYALLFGLIFTIPVYGYFLPEIMMTDADGGIYKIAMADLYIFLPVYVLLIWSLLATVKADVKNRKLFGFESE